MGKYIIIFTALVCFIICSPAFANKFLRITSADDVSNRGLPEKQSPSCPNTDCEGKNQENKDIPQLFSLGRSVGASYFHLIDLCDKSNGNSYTDLKQEYSDTFQNFNIIDIILEDIGLQGKSRDDLNKLRLNFYNALKDQDLNETQVAFVRDMFVVFYENLVQDINTKYAAQGSWFLSLGFYSAFQLESLDSSQDAKILLSGFDKILNTTPISLPDNVYNSMLAVKTLDKTVMTQTDLVSLKTNLVNIVQYFTNYPTGKPLFNEIQELVGVWQGILINPENEKHDIRLIVNKDLTATMDMSGIAEEVTISDIQVVNNYFTFMFKPFGTEKLYMRFDARVSENIFSGEITDVLGAKGYWVLAKTDDTNKLSDEKLDKMVSYLSQIEQKLSESPLLPVNDVKTTETGVEEEIPAQQIDEIIEHVNEMNLPELKENQEQSQDTPEPVKKEQKSFWHNLTGFIKRIFFLN